MKSCKQLKEYLDNIKAPIHSVIQQLNDEGLLPSFNKGN